MTARTLLVLASATLALGQRPFFAGTKPIGYPVVTTTEGLGDRFGEIDGTTQRLPIEANGDRDLIDRLSKLPIDNQPFWFINWQALEANRKKPQTYPQKPNPFVDPIQTNGGSTFDNTNSNSGNVNSDSGSTTSNSDSGNVNAAGEASVFVNRFGVEEYPNKNQVQYENSNNSVSANIHSNSSPGNNEVISTDKKKSPARDDKHSQAYHYK